MYHGPLDDPLINRLRESGLDPEELLNVSPGYDGTDIPCPTCGATYAHLGGIAIFPYDGHFMILIESNGINVRRIIPDHDPYEPGPVLRHVRGIGVAIMFSGECGHNWAVRYQFHKGNTIYSEVPAPNPTDPEAGILWGAIWRD